MYIKRVSSACLTDSKSCKDYKSLHEFHTGELTTECQFCSGVRGGSVYCKLLRASAIS